MRMERARSARHCAKGLFFVRKMEKMCIRDSKYAEEIGVEQSENENEPEENTNEAEVLRDKITGMINSLSPVLKPKAQKAVADAGLPTACLLYTSRCV